MSEDLEQIKARLLDQFKANGGTKDISNFNVQMILNELDHLREMQTLTDQLNALKKNATIQPIDDKGKFYRQPIDMGRENAALARKAAETIRGYYDYVEPPWDPRSIMDESLKRDNELLKAAEDDPRSVVILRDEEGRCI